MAAAHDRRQHDWLMGFLDRIFAGVRTRTAAGEETPVFGAMGAGG